MRGRGSTPATRGGATTATKAPAGGARGRTSPTKPAGTPTRGVSRGGSTTAASRTTGIFELSLTEFSVSSVHLQQGEKIFVSPDFRMWCEQLQ